MRCAWPAGLGFSPLDDELGLAPGGLSGRLREGVVRLGTWMPFAQAAEHLAFFWGVHLEESTVRRHTEAAGAAQVAVETAEVERLEREQPAGPPGPAVQQVSADGAMVPLVGGEWAEAKTVVVGTVVAERDAHGAPGVRTTELSYFSRLSDAETFGRLAWPELHQRGIETAGVVVAVQDGSVWLQGFVDLHRPDAVRILDFAHAVEHLGTAAQATFGPGTAASQLWLARQAHRLKRGNPKRVLRYLARRLDQIQYARFRALGYPIGSGCIESANKLVVEARLKGSGMHWARAHVNPLLALRTIACTNRWAEAWPRITAALRAQAGQRRTAGQRARRASRPHSVPPVHPPPAQLPALCLPPPHPPARKPLIVNGRPTPDHPWKKRPLLAGGHRHQHTPLQPPP